MHICYSDDREPFTGRPLPYSEQPAVKYWVRHYANFRYLRFIETSPGATRQEVLRAREEIRTCQGKMDHWQRHANWSAVEAAAARAAEDNKWRTEK